MTSLPTAARLLGVVAALALSATSAAAALVPPPTATQVFSGNDSNAAGQADFKSFVELVGGFDSSTLFQIDKVDAPSTGGGILSVLYDDAPGNSTTGSWSATQSVFFVAYKAGSFFTAAYYEPAVAGATWDTALLGLVNSKGKGQAISHITLYGATEIVTPEPGPQPVPLPAAAWLLIAGIGGLVGLRRFRG